MPEPLIDMERDGKTCRSKDTQVDIMKRSGWKVVNKSAKKEEVVPPPVKPSSKVSMEDIKKYLAKKGVEYHPNTGEVKIKDLYDTKIAEEATKT